MAREYTIEAMDWNAMLQTYDRWYILGAEKTSAAAQHAMAKYRKQFPKIPLRVVESGTRIIVVLNDPRPLIERSGFEPFQPE